MVNACDNKKCKKSVSQNVISENICGKLLCYVSVC